LGFVSSVAPLIQFTHYKKLNSTIKTAA